VNICFSFNSAGMEFAKLVAALEAVAVASILDAG
jgi:hypothetical protein